MGLESAPQDAELAIKTTCAGGADGCKTDGKEKERQFRHRMGQPAKGRKLGRSGAAIQTTGQKHQRGRGQADVDHQHQTALQALRIQRKDTHQHKADMADTGKGQQAAQVEL